jgi:hypothetical protein
MHRGLYNGLHVSCRSFNLTFSPVLAIQGVLPWNMRDDASRLISATHFGLVMEAARRALVAGRPFTSLGEISHLVVNADVRVALLAGR